jgi:putative hydrolase of the HAD superfamily
MRYLLWDFDGTLAQREGDWSGALVETAVANGIVTTRNAIRPFLQSGFPWHTPEVIREAAESSEFWWEQLEPVFFSAFKEGAGLPEEKASSLAGQVRDIYLDPRRWRVFDDVPPGLRFLTANGWQHIILSNHVPELEELLASIGLKEHFIKVNSSGRTGVEKPNPAAFRRVIEDVGVDADLWMIGDSWVADACAAEMCGIRSVLLRKSHADAKRHCPTLAELPAMLGDCS